MSTVGKYWNTLPFKVMNKLNAHIYISLKEQSVNESLVQLGEISPALTKSVSRNLRVVGQFTMSQVNKKTSTFKTLALQTSTKQKIDPYG